MPKRPPTKAPAWLFCLAVVAAWLLGAELAVVTEVGRQLPERLPGLAIWTFVACSIAFLVVTGRREILGGRQTVRLIAQLRDALASFGLLTEASLTALPLDGLLDQLLVRLGEALETEVAALLLCDQAGDFTFRASHGLDASDVEAFGVAFTEGLIGSIAATRVPQAATDARSLELLASQLQYPLVSAAGCPIVVEGRLIGVCVVGASVPRRFDDRRLQLLQLVADRAGVGIERARLSESQERSRAEAERARRHTVMLARASEVLLTAKDDYEDNLVALVGVVVPDLADWCGIELTDPDGGRRAVAVRHEQRPDIGISRWTETGTGSDGCWSNLRRQFPETAEMAAAAGASGASRLSPDDRAIVVAIQVDDAVIGTLTVAMDPGRPPYGAGDVSTAVELAGRAAITVERVLRYRNAREAAQAAQRTAAQLNQLVRASIDVQHLRDESEIIASIAERACQVFGARTAVVTAEADSEGPLEAVATDGRDSVVGRPGRQPEVSELPHPAATNGTPWRAGRWLGAPVAGHQIGAGGTVAILGRPDVDFSADDEAVLALLAQMVSAGLDNARLHHTTEASEARWRFLVEAAPIGIVEVTLDGGILWWNRAAMALFAWPDPPQRPALDWGSVQQSASDGDGPSFAPDTAAGLRTLWSEVMAGTPVIDRELIDRSGGGDIRDLAVSAAPLRSAGGSIYGILTLVADMTDRRRFEAELARAERMEAIAQLAGGVAHDFNNLLTLITGYTDLLNRRLEVDKHSVRLVDGVHAAVTRASLLTGQLLTISRRQTARPVVLSPVDALRSAAEVLQRVLGNAVELGWALDPHAGHVNIDPAHLEQVILNLAINARDAMPGGGRLDIGVDPALLNGSEAAALDIAPGRYVRISVSDSGTGMDAETCLRCFEPLFTTKGQSHGTGLGLAAVKGVVGGSGGAVCVDSTLGQGTTFLVYLPAVDESVVESASSQERVDPAGAMPTVGLGDGPPPSANSPFPGANSLHDRVRQRV